MVGAKFSLLLHRRIGKRMGFVEASWLARLAKISVAQWSLIEALE